MSKRRSKCKCDKFITWDEDDNEVKCKHCGIDFSVEFDSVLVYWLEEKLKCIIPYITGVNR